MYENQNPNVNASIANVAAEQEENQLPFEVVDAQKLVIEYDDSHPDLEAENPSAFEGASPPDVYAVSNNSQNYSSSKLNNFPRSKHYNSYPNQNSPNKQQSANTANVQMNTNYNNNSSRTRYNNNARVNQSGNQIKFEICSHIGVLSTSKTGWKRELNIVSWNDKPPRLDIRDWNPEHNKMGRGVGLNGVETENMLALLQGFNAIERGI